MKNPFKHDAIPQSGEKTTVNKVTYKRNKSHIHSPSHSSMGSYSTTLNSSKPSAGN